MAVILLCCFVHYTVSLSEYPNVNTKMHVKN